MKTLRGWTLALGLVVVTTVVALPPLALRWWQERGEWFPMAVGDRWTYRDLRGSTPVVFEVLRKTPGGAFVVERRIGSERTTFVLHVTPDSVFILEAGGAAFDPPFEEFRLPGAGTKDWTYAGRFGDLPLTVTSHPTMEGRRRFHVREHSTLTGWTTFTLERGKGVVELTGKASDTHSSELRPFEWRLESYTRGG